MLIKHQAGCLPLRQGPNGIEVLLVTSRYTGQWIAPKGTIEPGEAPRDTAAREAEEEAGVRGEIVGHLGRFEYPRGQKLGMVEAFVLRVTEELATWPEQDQRRRRWFSLDEAQKMVERAEVLQMLSCLEKGSF